MTVKTQNAFQRRILFVGTIFIIAALCIGIAAAEDRGTGSVKTTPSKSFSLLKAPKGVSCTQFTTSYMTTTDGSDLAAALVGSGVTITNPDYTGATTAAGTFALGTDGIGIDKGVILSSGEISYAVGPNTLDDVSYDNKLPGDPDLGALIPGYTTYDASVLEFDFIPVADVVTFDYVFASDEYNEWANTRYNDVFGFFLNGQNVALIPGTSTPVAINNVNGGNPFGTNAQNAAYFINNDLNDGGGALCTEMDGLTTVFTATAKVNKGEINHIKLAIADTNDHVWDSNVFIKAGTFTSPQLTLKPLSESTTDCKISHTVTATLVDGNGAAVPGIAITFTVTAGPNGGETGTAVTDVNGEAAWTYSGDGTSGTDSIVAKYGDLTSNTAYMTWNCGTVAPEFPTFALPVAMILGMIFIVYTVMIRKEE